MTPPTNTENGWTEHAKLVLATQKRHEGRLKDIAEKLEEIGKDVHLLKWQAGAWGLAAGTMGTALVLLVKGLLNGTT